MTIGWVTAIVGFILLAAWPLLTQDVFLQRIGALVLLAAISASAWNLLGGYAGQVSVGHSVYFGAGAYSSLVVYTELGWPPIAGAPLGVLVSCVLALVVGTPTFRLRGHYFSMATIAAAELARIVAANWKLVGAAVGLMGPPTPRTVADLSFISPIPYHYLFLTVLIVLLALTWQMQRSRMGYYLAAIRGGDRAARSLGVPVLRYKLYALLLSAGFTSIAGSLYAVMVGFIDPDSALGILISVKMVITAALVGAGTLFGPLVGAVILVPLEETTNAWFGGGGTGITFIIYGAIILLVTRFQPGGIAVIWRHATTRLERRNAVVVEATDHTVLADPGGLSGRLATTARMTESREEQAVGNSEGLRNPSGRLTIVTVLFWIFALTAAAVGKWVGLLGALVYGAGGIAYLIGRGIVSENKKALLWVMAAMAAQACWMIVAATYIMMQVDRNLEIRTILSLLLGVAYMVTIMWFMHRPTLRSCTFLFLYVGAIFCVYLLMTPLYNLTENVSKGVVLQIMIFVLVLLMLPLSYNEYRKVSQR